jgi:hypothetical protein
MNQNKDATSTAEGRLSISLMRGDAEDRSCVGLPDRFYRQFTAPHPKHPEHGLLERGCSILEAPPSIDHYWDLPHAYWLRQRVRRAQREGYEFGRLEQGVYLDDIFAINTSLRERQGHALPGEYYERPTAVHTRPSSCANHNLAFYGITRDGHLYAYAWVYHLGQSCLISTILGHGEHMKAGIMPQLIFNILRDKLSVPEFKYLVYYLHASGTPGLRFFKEQMGFYPRDVEWQRGDESDDGAGESPAADNRGRLDASKAWVRRVTSTATGGGRPGSSP